MDERKMSFARYLIVVVLIIALLALGMYSYMHGISPTGGIKGTLEVLLGIAMGYLLIRQISDKISVNITIAVILSITASVFTSGIIRSLLEESVISAELVLYVLVALSSMILFAKTIFVLMNDMNVLRQSKKNLMTGN